MTPKITSPKKTILNTIRPRFRKLIAQSYPMDLILYRRRIKEEKNNLVLKQNDKVPKYHLDLQILKISLMSQILGSPLKSQVPNSLLKKNFQSIQYQTVAN